MIINKHQYWVTKKQLFKLQKALTEIKVEEAVFIGQGSSRVLIVAEREALESEIFSLRRQIKEYNE